jgi:hypothetical protein
MAVIKEVRVFSLKRGGGHAVCEHVIGHVYNEMSEEAINEPGRYFVHLADLDLIPKVLPLAPRVHLQCLNYENKRAILMDTALMTRPVYGRDGIDIRPVVVLRDPYNWLSSVAKKKGQLWKTEEELIDWVSLWTLYARKFFIESVPGVFALNFNKWYTDEKYRAEFSAFLGEPPTDNGRDRVRGQGASSFDGTLFDGDAHKMQVLDRWQLLDDSVKSVLPLFPELPELSREIFQFTPAL